MRQNELYPGRTVRAAVVGAGWRLGDRAAVDTRSARGELARLGVAVEGAAGGRGAPSRTPWRAGGCSFAAWDCAWVGAALTAAMIERSLERVDVQPLGDRKS